MQAFPRRAWEREKVRRTHPTKHRKWTLVFRWQLSISRSHALRGNACCDALRRF